MFSRARRSVRLTHRPTGTVIAEGPVGWGITPFEQGYYVRRRYLAARFKPSYAPGLCPYKGLYQWLSLATGDGSRTGGLAWLYWLPNPLLPFIWFRVAVARDHPDIDVEEVSSEHAGRAAPA